MRRRTDLMACSKQLKSWATGEAAIRMLTGEADPVVPRSEASPLAAPAPAAEALNPAAAIPEDEKPVAEASDGEGEFEAPEDYLEPLEEDDPGPS
jgi:hypothetical protein